MSLELYVSTRGKLLPNPNKDGIDAIVYTLHDDTPEQNPPITRELTPT